MGQAWLHQTLLKADPVEYLLHLNLIGANLAQGDGRALEIAPTHLLPYRLTHLHSDDGRSLIVAIRKILLRGQAGLVFEKLDCVARVLGMAGHAATGNVGVCAPGLLVGKHHAHFLGDGHVLGVGRAQDSGHVTGVGNGDAVFIRGHALDLVGVAALGRAGHVRHHALKPYGGSSCAQMLMLCHGAEQAQVVGVRTGTNTQLALVLGVGQILVAVHVAALDPGRCHTPPVRGWNSQTKVFHRHLPCRGIGREWRLRAIWI